MQTRHANVIHIGRLKSDPMYIAAAGGKTARAEFAVSNATFRDGIEHVEYIRIIARNAQAGVVRDNLRANDLVCIEGKTALRHPRAGSPRTIYAATITFLRRRREIGE